MYEKQLAKLAPSSSSSKMSLTASTTTTTTTKRATAKSADHRDDEMMEGDEEEGVDSDGDNLLSANTRDLDDKVTKIIFLFCRAGED